jgi:hemerythrin
VKLGWKQAYSVGIEEIDRQHRLLLGIINQLQELRTPKAAEGEFFFGVLNSLVRYAEEHFRTEEELFVVSEYPALAPHQKAHVQFTADVFRLAHRLEEHNPRIREEIVEFLMSWFRSHVTGMDQEYKAHLQAYLKGKKSRDA